MVLSRDAGRIQAGRERRPRRRAEVASSPIPACPRCDSSEVVPAQAADPSEYVLELRSAAPPSDVEDQSFGEWLCTLCGYRWPHLRSVHGVGVGEPKDDGRAGTSDGPGDAVETLSIPDGSESAHVGPRDVGDALRRARERRGLELADASKGTFIRERYLRLLEDDATIEHFPAPVYARWFLKEYAEFLGLDPEPLVSRFEAEHPVEDAPSLVPLPNPRPRRRVLAVALAVASIASIVTIALVRGSDPLPRRVAPADVAIEAAGAVSPSDAAPDRSVALRGVHVVLRLSDRSWVEATADGRVLEAGATLEPGTRVRFHARRLLELVLGNAGAVRLVANGEPIETGAPGDVVRLELRWRDGELRTRFV